MRCRDCDKTDGLCYASLPPKVKCTVTGEYHLYDDECSIVLSCASNYDCVHDWVATTYGATTEGHYVQLVCRKCGKNKQIFNSYESLVDNYTTL